MKYRLPCLVKHLTSVLLIALTSASFAQDIPKDAASISAGKALFEGNCKSCHNVKTKLVGPALAGVDTRVPSIAWIKSWVHNSSKVIASGDTYAVDLYNKYNKAAMTSFTSLKDEQIMTILAYIKDAEAQPDAPKVDTTNPTNAQTPQGVPSEYLDIIMFGMILILVLLIIILGIIITALKKYLDDKNLSDDEKEVVHSPFTLGTIATSRGFIFLVLFVVAAVGFKQTIDGLYSIGVQKGYAPIQPIAFSHKLHAGQMTIDCKYCHTGVMKGKQANIPSPNICMNCHSQVKKGSPEIAKIYAAIGYDSVKEVYTGKQKPIEWIRVHNLPDLAYFNHSQHVNVGGIECQTCHGPIQEMDVVRQYSLLTMGWCIDCHRKTDVNDKGNAYYDKLMELHQNKKMKVEQIGGLECGKCHY